ncbi:MAG: hypothetical protein CBE26_00295 [Kiritimatiellaceae bacterium TMED266]|nr:MAG: hypothetical protein CBE26_00295 [Kiritimatiellaceae bacterium TMED266]
MQSALLQINPTLGALEHNTDIILGQAREAANRGAQLIVTPELALSGYPPEDLILKDHFCNDCQDQLDRLQQELPPEPLIIVGAPILRAGKKYNAAIVFHQHKIIGEYHKQLLPNYGVFDEKRLFTAGHKPLLFNHADKTIAIHICEDSWEPNGPAVQCINQPIDLLVNLSASPYHREKQQHRLQILQQTARQLNASLLYCNLVGGQDELVFDGASLILDSQGTLQARAPAFQPHTLCHPTNEPIAEPLDELPEIYQALKLGLHDYVDKTGFKKVIVALSGGIDSALVLAIASDALGSERIVTVTMPSRHSTNETLPDAIDMAQRLNTPLHQLPIEPLHNQFHNSLKPVWESDSCAGLTDENLQARIRGNLIMAISNEFGWLVLTTGNKSEIAMGYCTLYGDMCGGFALIKDVPKTTVFELCRWRNQQSEIIPPSIINRPPSAELRADQKDTDSLPPYEILDPILEAYVERDLGIDGLIAEGFDPELVNRVVHTVELSEYKRRQTPPGVKITPRSFDRDRRMPIVNRYRN